MFVLASKNCVRLAAKLPRSVRIARRYATTDTPPPATPRAFTRPQRDLPPLKRTWPTLLALGTLGVGSWVVFMAYVNNQERLSSSVMRQIMSTVREDEQLRELLGDAIRPEPLWYLNGDPWINGGVHLPQGNVDLSFRLKGHKGAGTLYFTSIRRNKGEQFTLLRFKVIGDNGQVVNIAAIPVTVM